MINEFLKTHNLRPTVTEIGKLRDELSTSPKIIYDNINKILNENGNAFLSNDQIVINTSTLRCKYGKLKIITFQTLTSSLNDTIFDHNLYGEIRKNQVVYAKPDVDDLFKTINQWYLILKANNGNILSPIFAFVITLLMIIETGTSSEIIRFKQLYNKWILINKIQDEVDFVEELNMNNPIDANIKLFFESYHFCKYASYVRRHKQNDFKFNFLTGSNTMIDTFIGETSETINDLVFNPPSHAQLYIIHRNNIYFYDPDKITSEKLKFKSLYEIIKRKIIPICITTPVQEVTDDLYCIFHVIRMMFLISNNNTVSSNKLNNLILGNFKLDAHDEIKIKKKINKEIGSFIYNINKLKD
jgi:hypothetical protein